MLDFTSVLLVFGLLAVWIYSWSRKPKDLPPGPSISLPIFGDVLSMGKELFIPLIF